MYSLGDDDILTVKHFGHPLDSIGPVAGGPCPFHQETAARLGRMVRALKSAKGDPYRAATVATNWGDEKLAGEFRKALAAGTGAAGGFAVPIEQSRDVIEMLRPASVVRRMEARTAPMGSDTLQVSKVGTGATASYIGENAKVPIQSPTFGQITLSRKKLAALVAISGSLVRSSTADAIVGNDLVAAIAQAENFAFINGDGTEFTPKGLRRWAKPANVVAATAGETLDGVVSDLTRLIQLLEDASVPMLSPGFLLNPTVARFLRALRGTDTPLVFGTEMGRGVLFGIPYAVTTQVLASEVMLVDFADVLVGEGGLFLDASDKAAYLDGATLVAAYSADQVIVRAISVHDLALRRDASVAVLTGVTWAL
jgi:HK97 family phage major capsid protein